MPIMVCEGTNDGIRMVDQRPIINGEGKKTPTLSERSVEVMYD